MTKVFLIIVDALRQDVVYGDEVETPNIDRLISEGITVDKAFSNGPHTSSAFPAILCSSSQNEGENCPPGRTVAAGFQDLGFETVGISTNPNSSPYYGYGRGFDEFVDFVKSGEEKEERSLAFKIGRKIVHSSDLLNNIVRKTRAKIDLPYERAERLNEALFEHWQEDEDQFFFLHYMETHWPYLPPQGFSDREVWDRRLEVNESLTSEEDPGEAASRDLWELYCGELRYLDSQIGQLIERAQERDEEAIILLSGDHGEQFGEFGYRHPGTLRNVQIQVPFILTGVETESDMASHLDIAPTLISHLGGRTQGFEGVDLSETGRERVTINYEDQRCVITPEWKLLDTADGLHLYSIDDYLEENDLSSERPETVKHLSKELRTVNDTEGLDI